MNVDEVCSFNGKDTRFSFLGYGFESRTDYMFVGVMANITDCRSVAMGSIPIRTAQVFMQYKRWWLRVGLPNRRRVIEPLMLLIVPGSVTVNISHFDCDVLSSNLSLVTKKMLALAYRQSIRLCNEGTGFDSRSQPVWLIVQWMRMLCYEHRDTSSSLVKSTWT